MWTPSDIPPPQDPIWGDPPLPAKVKQFREPQREAVAAIMNAYAAGKKIVVLDAPTGSGKTLIAEMVRRLLKIRALYVCVDRGLQDQVLRDFDYAQVLKGRRNYPTLNEPEKFDPPERLSCADCNRHGATDETTGEKVYICSWCDPARACPYSVAKRAALGAKLAVLNTAYFLLEANGPGGFSRAENRPGETEETLIIADEADRLENVLMSFSEVVVSGRDLEGWYLDLPTDLRPEGLRTWLETVLKKVEEERAQFDSGDEYTFARLTLREQRRVRHLDNLAKKLAQVQDELVDDAESGEGVGPQWVAVTDTTPNKRSVSFKPVLVRNVGRAMLWPHAPLWLVMSATVLDARRMLTELGADDSEWAEVKMTSSFPIRNRPVVSWDVTPVTYKTRAEAPDKLSGAIGYLLQKYPESRVLIHTFSYQLMRDLAKQPTFALRDIGPRMVWYEGSDTREQSIQRYLDGKNSVLIAPALERGLDLPDDACRVVIICKVPYPYLGDPQVAARQKLAGGEDWYLDQTVRSLVQMTGRGMRHEDDWCVSFILDSEFRRIFRRDMMTPQGRFPEWWKAAVKL